MLAFNNFGLVKLCPLIDFELDLFVEVAVAVAVVVAVVVAACSSELVSEGLTDDCRHLFNKAPWCRLACCCCCC